MISDYEFDLMPGNYNLWIGSVGNTSAAIHQVIDVNGKIKTYAAWHQNLKVIEL